jgi:hypothetical protein
MQNWGKELKLWLGERVVPVVVDDTRADHVKKSFQVGAAMLPESVGVGRLVACQM